RHRRHGLEREIRIGLSENVRRRNGYRRRWRVLMTSHDERDATEEERNAGLCERNVVRGGGGRRRPARWACPADKTGGLHDVVHHADDGHPIRWIGLFG